MPVHTVYPFSQQRYAKFPQSPNILCEKIFTPPQSLWERLGQGNSRYSSPRHEVMPSVVPTAVSTESNSCTMVFQVSRFIF